MSPVKSARTPLWSRLAQALANDIVSGKYPVDSLLPTEMQLMELHDVSRHTVREALAELVQLGLIERRPRSGTRVIAAGDLPVFHPVDLPHHRRPRTRQVLELNRRICDEITALSTGFSLRTPLLFMRHLEPRNDAMPSAYVLSWIRDTARDIVPYLSRETNSTVIDLLERHADIRCQTLTTRCTAVAADETAANLLNVPPGSPLLQCETLYRDRRGSLLILTRRLSTGPEPGYTIDWTRSQG